MPDTARPFVSVVVPCRNEREHVETCLASILANDYPADRREVVLVDGMSDDGTRERILAVAARHPEVRLVDNPARVTPAALNLGIAQTSGEIILRMDTHVRYPRGYIARLVEALESTGADNVGGVLRTLPGSSGLLAEAIAIGMAHPFGVGNAAFRTGASAPAWVDTVPFGCFRRSLFERLGGFDPELVRNQDDELNGRILRAGGRILLLPDVVVEYYARRRLGQLARMYYQYGFYKPLVVRKLGHVPTVRQLVPPALLLALAGSALFASLAPDVGAPALALVAGAYLLAVTAAAATAWWRTRRRAALLLSVVFPVLHWSYGAGYLRGVLPALRRPRRSPHVHDVALTR
ncbi:MAG TPA: glycosyltransferase family 2 protein [Gemmatimonadales bacterium]|nr:glycosyltransferase family 2 protein [Gemmatimonadales bacterium]